MNIRFSILGSALLILSLPMSVKAEPSRTFFTETAAIAQPDSISLDLDYRFTDNATGTGIRAGKLGGELLLNTHDSDFVTTSVGYKRALQDNLAMYGILSHINSDELPESYTDFALGIAYSMQFKQIGINLNGEFVTDDSETLRGGDSTIFLKAAIIVPLTIDNNKTSLIAEIAAENNDNLDTGYAFGGRWQMSPQLTTDFILHVDDGRSDATGIPGYIKVNYRF